MIFHAPSRKLSDDSNAKDKVVSRPQKAHPLIKRSQTKTNKAEALLFLHPIMFVGRLLSKQPRLILETHLTWCTYPSAGSISEFKLHWCYIYHRLHGRESSAKPLTSARRTRPNIANDLGLYSGLHSQLNDGIREV